MSKYQWAFDPFGNSDDQPDSNNEPDSSNDSASAGEPASADPDSATTASETDNDDPPENPSEESIEEQATEASEHSASEHSTSDAETTFENDNDLESQQRPPASTLRDELNQASDSDDDEFLVRLDDVSIQFGSQHVLRNISLEIPRGQTVVLIGESGCGKSVLMKSIIGLIQPTFGTVYFDEQNINELSDRELSLERKRFGFVFQNAALFDSMTVGQNVAFPLKQHSKYSPSQVDELVHSRLAEVGLPGSVVTKKPAELSGGMRKRVGLARALMLNPELVVYDEPTTGLDPIMSDVINELILRTRRSYPVTSIVVTHDMHTARKVGDRIVMVYPISRLEDDEPQVLYDGPPDGLDECRDRRVRQFVNGEAGERLMEMSMDEASA